MTKHTDKFLQFAEPVTCREYTLPRVEKSSDPKGWIRGNTKIGPVFEVTTSYLPGNYGVEISIESVNKDNSHSWVRLSHGLNKLVTDLSNKEYVDNEQETSTTKTEVFSFASRYKAKATTEETFHYLLIFQGLYIFLKENGLILNQELNSIKHTQWQKVLTLFFYTGELLLEEDGAIEFCILKRFFFGTKLRILNIGLMICGRVRWRQAEATRRDFNIVLIYQDKKLIISELFKVIQDAISIDPSPQDNVLTLNNFLEYACHMEVQSIYIPSQIQD